MREIRLDIFCFRATCLSCATFPSSNHGLIGQFIQYGQQLLRLILKNTAFRQLSSSYSLPYIQRNLSRESAFTRDVTIMLRLLSKVQSMAILCMGCSWIDPMIMHLTTLRSKRLIIQTSEN